MKLFMLLAALLCSSLSAQAPFATLEHARAYAASVPEYPVIDNNDWLNPDFTTFHKTLAPSWWQRVAHVFGAAPQPAWTPQSCVALLERTAEARKKSNNIVVERTFKLHEKIIVWGDVQGAFHSLLRDLGELERQGVIDNNLRIVAPGYYFIFNGNVVGRSAYSLETLCLGLRLLEENPEHVFYLRGTHEDGEHWRDYGLKRELVGRLSSLSSEAVPFASLVSGIFATLPLALYVRTEQAGTTQLLRISPSGRDDRRIDESALPGRLEAIIKGQDRTVIYQETDGLKLLPPDRGATAWTALSCPTGTYQKLYSFYNDAFCQITIAGDIEDSTLGLYYQDARKQDGFKRLAYDISVGQSIDAGALEKTFTDKKKKLVFGCTVDLSKTQRTMGVNVVQGVSACFNKINNAGGIGGHALRFVVLDDQYSPAIARSNVEALLRDYGTNMLLAPLGSPTTQASLDLVREKKVLMLFPVTGATVLRAPDLEYLVHYAASYGSEGAALVSSALEKLQSGKFAFFYQDDAFGKALLEGATAELKRRGITGYKELPYTRQAVDFAAQIKEVSEYNPDALFFFSTTTATQLFIRQLGVEHVAGKMLFGNSDLGAVEFKHLMRAKGIRITVANVVPNPHASMLPIVKEYRADMAKEGYGLDPSSLQAYIAASILVDFIRTIKFPITKEKLLGKIQAAKDYAFKGLTLSYDARTGELTRDVWLDTGTGDWLYVPAKQTVAPESQSGILSTQPTIT